MRIEAILFDCDGVLVDSEAIYQTVELQMLAQLGLTFERPDYQNRFMGLRSADYLARLEAESRARLRRGLPEDFALRLDAACRERLMADLQAIKGVHGLLNAVRAKVAVASSSATDLLHAKLRKTGLHARFNPNIFSGDQVDRGKPAPDLFLHAARQIGVAPEHCLVIEDSVNGVRAGKGAGMAVWGFAGGGHVGDAHPRLLRSAGAEAVFGTFDQLRAALDDRQAESAKI